MVPSQLVVNVRDDRGSMSLFILDFDLRSVFGRVDGVGAAVDSSGSATRNVMTVEKGLKGFSGWSKLCPWHGIVWALEVLGGNDLLGEQGAL